MTGQSGFSRYRMLALWLVLIGISLATLLGPARQANASITLIDFTAEAKASNSILIKWETGTEANTAGFNLRRALSAAELGTTEPATPALVFIPNTGDAIFGDSYNYTDTEVTPGVLYYYRLYEVSLSGGTGDASWIVSAGIGVPTLTPTLTATATATATATVSSGAAATRTPTATGVAGNESGGQPTATRRFTNTPVPATATLSSTSTPVFFASATAAPVGPGVVSTPTSGPQPQPTAVLAGIAATVAPTPFAPRGDCEPDSRPLPGDHHNKRS